MAKAKRFRILSDSIHRADEILEKVKKRKTLQFRSNPRLYPPKLRARAEVIYERLKEDLETKYMGQIVVIDVESEDCFVDEDYETASDAAHAKHPDVVCYARRIGPNPGVMRVPWV